MLARGLLVAGLFLLATPALAQFAECPVPSTVPVTLFVTISVEADVSFGESSSATCTAIAKKGRATCRAQTKAAASCLRRSIQAVYEIGVKECNQLDQPDRSACKDELKARRDDDRDSVGISQQVGLDICDGDFFGGLENTCEGLMKE